MSNPLTSFSEWKRFFRILGLTMLTYHLMVLPILYVISIVVADGDYAWFLNLTPMWQRIFKIVYLVISIWIMNDIRKHFDRLQP